jgi:hypothetical protein
MLPPIYGWVLNLDADLELANPSYNPSEQLTQKLDAWGSHTAKLVGRRGRRLPLPPGSREENLLGRAFCPTPRALAFMRAAGVRPEQHPRVEILRRVNHRAFSCALERGLPTQCLVRDEASLYELLKDTRHPWLLKRPLAFAGRGQWRVMGEVEATGRAWITASLRRDVLLVEPLVTPTAEFSLHGFVWPDGHYEVGRVCVQKVSDRGAFQGAVLARGDDLRPLERDAMEEALHLVAKALREAGYFGPFGIDAYRYRTREPSGREGFCALSEINARYTMAFATGFPIHPSDLHLSP